MQAQAALSADRAQVAALTVRSATSGIIQSVEVDPGTSVAQNAVIAHVADASSLKAVLQVAESDVHAVSVGMRASIDTGNGVFDGPRLARGAGGRERHRRHRRDVSRVRCRAAYAPRRTSTASSISRRFQTRSRSRGRPAPPTAARSSCSRSPTAARARYACACSLGRGSADRVPVLSGLEPGDTAIVSDMSNYIDQTTLSLR